MARYQKIYDKISSYGFSIDEIKKFKGEKFIVMEKINGANFSINYDKNSISFSKRNGKLNETDWFFNYHTIKDKLSDNMKQLCEYLKMDNIIVYGELCGGYYPHKDINNMFDDDMCIAHGIYYSPNIELIVYDIAYKKDSRIYFLNYDEFLMCKKNCNFTFIEPLFIGTYEQAISYNINQNSKISQLFKLPELKENIMEGIVIKPFSNIMFENIRPLIKIKNPQFKEISDDIDIEELNKNYKHIFHMMLNKNRIHSAISKIGEYKNHIDEIKKELFEDIMADCYISFPEIKIDNYSEAEEYLKKYIENYAIFQ